MYIFLVHFLYFMYIYIRNVSKLNNLHSRIQENVYNIIVILNVIEKLFITEEFCFTFLLNCVNARFISFGKVIYILYTLQTSKLQKLRFFILKN